MSLASLRATLRSLDLRESEDPRIVEAKLNLAKAREAVRLELHPQRIALIEQIGEAQKAKTLKTALSPVLESLLKRLSIGVEYSGKLRITWHDDIPRFVIVSVGGGSYLSGQTRQYGQAGHWLVDLMKDDGKEKGWRLRCQIEVSKEVSGRLTKSALNSFKTQAHALSS